MPSPSVKRFLLMPARGTSVASSQSNDHMLSTMRSMLPASLKRIPAPKKAIGIKSGSKKTAKQNAAKKTQMIMQAVKVLDSLSSGGVKLVEMTAQQMLAVREEMPGMRVIPEVFYKTARFLQPTIAKKFRTAAGITATASTFTFVNAKTKDAIAHMRVVAFTNLQTGEGVEADTNEFGKCKLRLPTGTTIERLYAFPLANLWPMALKNVIAGPGLQFELKPIKLTTPDILQYFRSNALGADGAGVRIGVIDTGCGPHNDLVISGGMNTVYGENPNDYKDNGAQHGTHVAGIISANGGASGLNGFAPKAQIFAYRVFGKNNDGASNFAIVKAIEKAVQDGCDLINMSLGGEPGEMPDLGTSNAIADARAAGVAVICASGNDGANQISQPGGDARSVAVGAFGRKGLYPSNTVSSEAVGKLGAPDKKNFMANFSNSGFELDMVGPGVGVVSTVPQGYAVMDGTSMASPAVTGALARLLSASPVLKMARNQARSDAILKLAYTSAKLLGFEQEYEGHGWIK